MRNFKFQVSHGREGGDVVGYTPPHFTLVIIIVRTYAYEKILIFHLISSRLASRNKSIIAKCISILIRKKFKNIMKLIFLQILQHYKFLIFLNLLLTRNYLCNPKNYSFSESSLLFEFYKVSKPCIVYKIVYRGVLRGAVKGAVLRA